jgi:hypothetical protein
MRPPIWLLEIQTEKISPSELKIENFVYMNYGLEWKEILWSMELRRTSRWQLELVHEKRDGLVRLLNHKFGQQMSEQLMNLVSFQVIVVGESIADGLFGLH